MRHHGATRVYAKRLAPNDNSKNQPYLSRDFSALNVFPHGDVYSDASDIAGAVRNRAKADIRLFWIDEAGKYLAPNAKMILYPKYPEVRLSGFLKGCPEAPRLMVTRASGRILFLAVNMGGEILAYAASADDPITAELNAHEWDTLGVLLEIPVDLARTGSPKTLLLNELRRIYQLQWIASQKLAADGAKEPYAARNGGGYTLEAELGITPNGYAEPDFMGWEVKQYSVNNLTALRPKSPVTLMTPEPTGGIYRAEGVAAFLRQFGYADQSGVPDRFNFGGRYDCQTGYHRLTGLRMTLSGYDTDSGKITDMTGGMALIDDKDQVAASWTFSGMMAHWNRKHAQAAYVPSVFRAPPPAYHYGAQVLLCEKTDFLLFLKAFAAGRIYYDPAVKIEHASSASPTIKRRSQFRVAHTDLTELYAQHETALLAE